MVLSHTNVWEFFNVVIIEDGREGKGRRCYLGDRTASIPCRASYFAPGRFGEEADFHLDELKE